MRVNKNNNIIFPLNFDFQLTEISWNHFIYDTFVIILKIIKKKELNK